MACSMHEEKLDGICITSEIWVTAIGLGCFFDTMFEHMPHIEHDVAVDYANSSTNNHIVEAAAAAAMTVVRKSATHSFDVFTGALIIL